MLLRLFIEPIAYAKLVGDVILLALSRLIANLSADVCHIYLQLFDTSFVGGISPNRFEDRHICHHLAAVFGKECHNIIFCLGKLNGFTLYVHLSGIVINL